MGFAAKKEDEKKQRNKGQRREGEGWIDEGSKEGKMKDR